jgi:hypothetical protein
VLIQSLVPPFSRLFTFSTAFFLPRTSMRPLGAAAGCAEDEHSAAVCGAILRSSILSSRCSSPSSTGRTLHAAHPPLMAHPNSCRGQGG